MAEAVTSYIIENDKEFQRLLDDALKKSDDLRIPLGLIRNDWYRSNRAIFKLKGPGQYPDFKSEAYKKRKKRVYGFDYPLLKATGALATSITVPNSNGAFSRLQKRDLIMGSNIEYLKYHQSDKPRKKMPLRKVIFIDGGPFETSKGSSISGRIDRWTNIIGDYIGKTLEGK